MMKMQQLYNQEKSTVLVNVTKTVLLFTRIFTIIIFHISFTSISQILIFQYGKLSTSFSKERYADI